MKAYRLPETHPLSRAPRPGAAREWTLVDYGITTLITNAEGDCVAEFAAREDAEFVLAAIRQMERQPRSVR